LFTHINSCIAQGHKGYSTIVNTVGQNHFYIFLLIVIFNTDS